MTAYGERRRAGVYDAQGAPASSHTVEATDAATEKAAELGVDIAYVTGTGKDGRVTVADVQAAAESSE